MELFNVVTVDEARKIIDSNFSQKLDCEIIGIEDCTGRITYEDIISECNVPGFRRSTVDGYAVRSKDVFGASESIPAILNIIGEVQMGKPAPAALKAPGDCMYVPTGGMLPDGSDCVVMIEYTDKLDDRTVLVNSPAGPLDNVVAIGEDIKSGETIIKGSSMIRPYEAGVLASLGIDKVKVMKKPKVAIISTGDEIVDINETPALGQTRDINTYLLYSLIMSDNGIPCIYGLVKDDYEILKHTVDCALSECDIVLISGGSSVGKKDQTLNVINSLGSPGVLIHGLAVKPGKPTIVGKARDRIIYGLPGHPLACAVIYNILVKYYMERLYGLSDAKIPVSCSFSINYHKAKGREEYLPVMLKKDAGGYTAEPIFTKSGLISGFSKAWGYVKIERNTEGLKAGEAVEVYKF